MCPLPTLQAFQNKAFPNHDPSLDKWRLKSSREPCRRSDLTYDLHFVGNFLGFAGEAGGSDDWLQMPTGFRIESDHIVSFVNL